MWKNIFKLSVIHVWWQQKNDLKTWSLFPLKRSLQKSHVKLQIGLFFPCLSLLWSPPFLPFSLSLSVMGLFTDIAFRNVNHWIGTWDVSQATQNCRNKFQLWSHELVSWKWSYFLIIFILCPKWDTTIMFWMDCQFW